MKYYAHSGDLSADILNPQPYELHVKNVYDTTLYLIDDLLKLSILPNNKKSFIMDSALIAAYWHDVGKLDVNIQKYLCQNSHSDEKMLNHVDAGIAITLKYFKETGNTSYLMAAVLIHSHHIGLPDWNDIISEKKPRGFLMDMVYNTTNKIRDCRNIKDTYDILTEYLTVRDYIDNNIDLYIKIQETLLNFIPVPSKNYKIIDITGMDVRMMFACLVDADHSDTDKYYSGINFKEDCASLNAVARLNTLQSHVNTLSKTSTGNIDKIRIESRNKLFDLCLNHIEIRGVVDVEAPVGTGKTTAVMAASLQMAIKNKCDRIITILPYINVISQTVETYRKCLLEKDEDKLIINEIHSKTEFEEPRLRKYSKQWKSPVNVSTAVQFFESLVANNTSSIRKIHWFSNSVIIFDEYDKAMPHNYWKYILPLLIELNEKYNIHFIFSSGTPIDYFNLYNIDNSIKSEILNEKEWNYFQKLESRRIKTKIIKKPINTTSEFEKIIFKRIKKHNSNSALIVLNTIVNSLLTFEMLHSNKMGYKVYQLSSSLTPHDKELVLKEVKQKLKNKEKIILVATTIVECGVDVSFDVGFKQKASLSSVLQFNGRVNRNSIASDGTVYVFDFSDVLADNRNGIFTENPQLNVGRNVFDTICKDGKVSPVYCQTAVEQEILSNRNLIDFTGLELRKSFKTISEEFNVINSSTVLIIVNADIADRIRKGWYVSATDINRNCIQLWTSKYNKIETIFGGIEQITSKYGDVYLVWTHEYDPKFYGIGKMLLDLRETT